MQMGEKIRGVGCQVPNKWGFACHCHGDFIIVRGKYLVKGEKIRKGMEGRNGSHCLLFLFLAFAFYKELYSVGIFVCLLLLLSSSFMGAD